MKIEVGDRVTFKDGVMEVVDSEYAIEEAIGCGVEIIKVERPNWEVVEEKKELLTEEEREFLKDMCKYYEINMIKFYDFEEMNMGNIVIYNNDRLINVVDYPKNMEFKGVARNKEYTPKELRIGGINNGFR